MNTKPYLIIARLTFIISVVLYLVSLAQPCFSTANSNGERWQGIYILGMGAIGGIMSPAGLTWYANPVLWVAWSYIKKRSPKSLIASSCAAAIALSFLFFERIADNEVSKSVPITGYQLGYWLWVASMVVMLIGTFILYPWMKRIKITDEIPPFVYDAEELKKLKQ